MKLANGDLWSLPADAICITTNGSVRRDGRAVMGRGCALQAAKKFPELPMQLGMALQNGNCVKWLGVHYMTESDPYKHLIAFPVKHAWYEKADLALIEKSAEELMMLATGMAFKSILLPRPGCGNGGLQWKDVKAVIEPILDDRITVVDF